MLTQCSRIIESANAYTIPTEPRLDQNRKTHLVDPPTTPVGRAQYRMRVRQPMSHQEGGQAPLVAALFQAVAARDTDAGHTNVLTLAHQEFLCQLPGGDTH